MTLIFSLALSLIMNALFACVLVCLLNKLSHRNDQLQYRIDQAGEYHGRALVAENRLTLAEHQKRQLEKVGEVRAEFEKARFDGLKGELLELADAYEEPDFA